MFILSRPDPGRSVLSGFGVHRRRLRAASVTVRLRTASVTVWLLPVSSIGKDRVLQRILPPGAAEEPEGDCPGVPYIGHPGGNLHRAGLTGRPLAGVPSGLRRSRRRFGIRHSSLARDTEAHELISARPPTIRPRALPRACSGKLGIAGLAGRAGARCSTSRETR